MHLGHIRRLQWEVCAMSGQVLQDRQVHADVEELPPTLDQAHALIRSLNKRLLAALKDNARITQEKDELQAKYNDMWVQRRRLEALQKFKQLQPIDSDLTDYLYRKWRYSPKERDASGRLCINKNWAAKDLGRGEDTIDRRLDRLEQVGFVSDITRHSDPQSDYERVYLRVHAPYIDEICAHPERAVWPEDLPTQGGNQYQCRRCDSTNVAIKNVKWLRCLNPDCPDYGKEHIIEPGEYRPQHVENGHKKQKRQKQLAFERKVDSPAILEDDSNLGNNVPITPLPPSVPQVAADTSEHDQGDIAALYLAIGDPCHVEMIAKPHKKYTTVHRPLTPGDVEAHIEGLKTIGTKLAHQDRRARLFIVDADNEHDRALLRAGARKLAAAGFFPLIEAAPADKPTGIPGYHDVSEHGIVVLDQAHDIPSTWAAIHSVAEEWAAIAEHWPGSRKRVRLPAGVYRMPGYSGWCTLSSVADGEVATDGRAAARLLLAHQSLASLIPPLPIPVVTSDTTQPQAEQGGGRLMDSPVAIQLARPSLPGNDVMRAAIAQFEDSTSWDEVFYPWSSADTRGRYSAMRNGVLENEPSIILSNSGRLYCDYGATPVMSKDKLGWHCYIRGIDERSFKAALCADYRGAAVDNPPAPRAVPSSLDQDQAPQSDEERLDALGERLNYPRLELAPWSRVAPGRENWQKFKRSFPGKVAAMLAVAAVLP
jgi:hypothetical protein